MRLRNAALAGALAAGTMLAASACGASSHGASHYGGYPSFLPSSTLHTDPHHVVTGTVAKPAYAVQGDPVDVRVAQGSALVDVTGPATPGQGLAPEPATPYCTFEVTITGESGSVPLRLADFTTLDEEGAQYRMTPGAGATALPPTIAKGQTLHFAMRTEMPTGEGLLHWVPGGGHLAPVAWDFTVETD